MEDFERLVMYEMLGSWWAGAVCALGAWARGLVSTYMIRKTRRKMARHNRIIDELKKAGVLR